MINNDSNSKPVNNENNNGENNKNRNINGQLLTNKQYQEIKNGQLLTSKQYQEIFGTNKTKNKMQLIENNNQPITINLKLLAINNLQLLICLQPTK